MPTRRKALGAVAQAAAGLALLPFASRRAASSVLVNDIHSQLNPTRVERIVAIDSEATMRAALAAARAQGKPVCVAGGRHAMGGQQFAGDAVLLDMRAMRRIVGLDEQGVVEAEAGIQWPELIERLIAMQAGQPAAWGIIQKQTGADRLTLGGALGANIHGRGLALKPIIGDVESFTLMHADGSLSTCSRSENRELFSLVIGGYGLFGVVTRVRLRLRPRTKLERVVRIIDIDELMPAFAQRVGEGYLYGDCQFSTDAGSDTYLRKGVFACYRPLAADAPMPAQQKELGEAQWRELYYLSHADTRRAYDAYTSFYMSTSGQRYWSDLAQLSVYIDDYHADLDRRLGNSAAAISSPITAGPLAAKSRRAIRAWSSFCRRSGGTILPRSSRAIGIAITSGCSQTSSSRRFNDSRCGSHNALASLPFGRPLAGPLPAIRSCRAATMSSRRLARASKIDYLS
ncbi:MAG TPA: FAD-binding oxidoreductase [Xanthobacteraceae bacterium]